MKTNITFDVLDYKKYILNGDENNVLRITTSDYGIIDRIYKAQEEVTAMYDRISERKNPDVHILSEMDAEARRIINEVFDDGDVCTKAFGNKNCLSPASNGKAMLLNFLEAIIPVITKEFGDSIEKVQNKTAKYTEIVEAEPPALPDMSDYTPEQKAAILAQLMQ